MFDRTCSIVRVTIEYVPAYPWAVMVERPLDHHRSINVLATYFDDCIRIPYKSGVASSILVLVEDDNSNRISAVNFVLTTNAMTSLVGDIDLYLDLESTVVTWCDRKSNTLLMELGMGERLPMGVGVRHGDEVVSI